MEWWKHGKLQELISECEAIQTRLKKSVNTKKQLESLLRLMLQGQVKRALRFVDNANEIDGKHDITTNIAKYLKEKHPTSSGNKTICHN